MKSRKSWVATLVATGLIALGVGLLAPGAGAKPRTGVFMAKLKVTQTNNWRASYKYREKCDISFWGRGRDVVRLRSGWTRIKVELLKSARLHAFAGKGRTSWESYFMRPSGKDTAGFKMRGTVTRSSKYGQVNPPPECAVADGNGDYVPPKPDCGRRKIRGVTFSTSRDYNTGFLKLKDNRGLTLQRDPFRHCRVFGTAWPHIQTRDDKTQVAGTPEPADILLKRRLKKIILIGKGKTSHTGTGIWGNTKMEWTMTLRRIR